MVLRSDDPSRSRYYDALAAGCIPVLVNDMWDLMAAPFAHLVPHSQMAVRIPEHVFLQHLPGALALAHGLNDQKTRLIVDRIQTHRNSLLWTHVNATLAMWNTVSATCAYDH